MNYKAIANDLHDALRIGPDRIREIIERHYPKGTYDRLALIAELGCKAVGLEAKDVAPVELEDAINNLVAERDAANAACNEVLNSLEWSGDGYEWNPPHGDYREQPTEALNRGMRAHNERLAAANYERNLAQLQATTLRKALETANDAMCQASLAVKNNKSDLNHAIDVARKALAVESTTKAHPVAAS